ncbi:uncharacterized protein [Montipora capricornis]|uniref:uncharacterized protein n=1 Tax=Montipora capricornis TaxID=246305 RepID=UPI0035F1B4FE
MNGYELLGPGLKTCAQSKKWVPENNPSCHDVMAPTFQNCSSNIIETADRGLTSATVTWIVPMATDNSGSIPNITHFGKQPGERFLAGEHTIKYLASDETGNIAKCEFKVFISVVRCVPRLYAPDGGTIDCNKNNIYGSECSFTCNTGYNRIGSANRICESNHTTSVGYWTGNEARCQLARCPHLFPHPNSGSGCGSVAKYTFGATCRFSCYPGYQQINGSRNIICQANGTWSGEPLYCQVVRCQTLKAPKDGFVKPDVCTVSPKYKDACQFSCKNGYKLHGNPVTTCLDHGEWSLNTSLFICQDVERPSFGVTCPSSDIKRYADKGTNYTTVTWNPVIATDNSGVAPNVSASGVENVYYKGKSLVTYIARDEAGNNKSCKFYVTVEVLQCRILQPPVNGFFVGDCGNIYGSVCRIRCDNGYNLLGSENVSCEVYPGGILGHWDNPLPACEVRRCSSLKEPQFGYVYPPMCKSLPIYGTTCTFGCKYGFLSDGGLSLMHCANDGTWNKSESLILKCSDVIPPTFMSCPSDIHASLSVNSSASVNWTIPVAVDNSKVTPTMTVLPPGVAPPYTFLNTTLIVYTAKDAAGNERHCSFKVTLEDNTGPEVVYCPPDQDITVSQMKTVVTWQSPEFKDNSNSLLNIECSHESGIAFFWGTWNVQCRAYDSNPSNDPALCQFTLRLKPNDCEDIAPPLNGAKACDYWALGKYCSPFCNVNWDFTSTLAQSLWVCGASGKWFPHDRWPDCTTVYQPNAVRMAGSLHYFSGNCSSPEAQLQIKQNFIEILNASLFNAICNDPAYKDDCKVENVKVTCSEERKRRALDEEDFHTRIRRSAGPLTTITFDIVVRLHGTGVNDTRDAKILAGVEGIEIAKNISSNLRKAVDNGSLILTVDGTVFLPDKNSLNISEPERSCASGQSYRDGFCVSCYLGTYLNKTLGTCADCPVGTYQDQVSQEKCVSCPPKTSTEQTRTYNNSGCIALCKAGSYSPTGMEPCFPCEKGYYQEFEGQSQCTKCNADKTTSGRGSNSTIQCKVPCAAGSFSPTGFVPCTLCNQRSFQPRNESRLCQFCPGTTITMKPGSESSHDCLEIDECESNPCMYNSTCTDLVGDFFCTCQPGYTGKQCKINIDDCQDQPCLNNGTCHDFVNNYTCTCANGYQGFNCQDDVDECVSSLCLNNATCRNFVGGYTCLCKPGFTGIMCDTEIDECVTSPCLNEASCTDKINQYECICVSGYRGRDCEENIDDCASDPCKNDAQCADGVDSYTCICPAGFNGTNCEHEIDECMSVDCKNNATCLDQVNDFYCVCPQGFTGKTCEVNIDECASSPCKNEARCVDGVNGYHCTCKDGFEGLHCEVNIDDCASDPCSNNGSCHDGVNNFTCICPLGFTGNTCNLDMDFCVSMPCLNNASCFDGLTSFTCQCLDGFNGDKCQYNVDDCQNKQCFNGGTCSDGIDEYTCLCPPGFTGFNCEININECAQNPCLNEGTCTDLVNDFKCTCKSGYTGRDCSVDVDECSSSPCQNNGTCNDEVDGYTCDCIHGFSGRRCEVNVDDCLVHPCFNGATCVDGINSYSCLCPPGFRGDHCKTEVNECESLPCFYGGTCHDQVNGFYCVCPFGFSGQQCEVNIDDCHSNPCMNNGRCTDLVANFSCSCSAGFAGSRCEQRIDYCKDANCTRNGICVNLFTGFHCNCSAGFYGKYCELNLDECAVGPCFNNATCHDGINSFTCSCLEGYIGRYCELNVEDCFNNTCQNNATCIDEVSGYSCRCADGFNGTYCDTEINECESNPCENNSTCVDETPGYRCMCSRKYIGRNCENLSDVCSSSPCENGGTCLGDNSTGTFNCSCKAGFTGETCDVNIDDCASGPCTMPNAYCVDQIDGYKCVCYPSHTGDNCEIFLGSNFDLIFKAQTTDDMVLLSDRQSIPNMRSFTIAFFVRAEFAHTSGIIFSYSVPNMHEDVIILSYTASQVHIEIKHEIVRVDFRLADGLWHFLGVVWSGQNGTVTVYIDGIVKKMASDILTNGVVAGGGWIVLGQRYLAGDSKTVLSKAFVGTLHQFNIWNVPAMEFHMWNAAHNCTWAVSGSVRSWSSFIQGIKGKVEKRFKTQCKAKEMCTTNCSHFLYCESREGFYFCTCQAGFTGFHCNINIDDCSWEPCVNGSCVDGVNRYDCVCNEGYWGKFCQKRIDNEKECRKLPEPKNGKKACRKVSGSHLCTLTCNEGDAFTTTAITEFTCGPDTDWNWNGIENPDIPACSKIGLPNEIQHHVSVSFPEVRCGQLNGLRASIEEEVDQTLSTIPGCVNDNACKITNVLVPECGWTSNQKRRRSVGSTKKVLFSLSVKPSAAASLPDDIEETSEAILFQMQYVVSTGKFSINFNGINSTADKSSFEHLSSNITCSPGFVSRNDETTCVACPVGTFHQLSPSSCISCSRGNYQDEEGQLSCKPCGKGHTTSAGGASSITLCDLAATENIPEDTLPLKIIIPTSVAVAAAIFGLFTFCRVYHTSRSKRAIAPSPRKRSHDNEGFETFHLENQKKEIHPGNRLKETSFCDVSDLPKHLDAENVYVVSK